MDMTGVSAEVLEKMEHIMGDKGTAVETVELKKYYTLRKGFVDKLLLSGQKHVKAVDDISLRIRKGETFGLVGESGCGKSTFGRCILRLEPITAGTIKVFGQNIHFLIDEDIKTFRKQAQVVFQNPYSTLPPHKTIGNMLKEVVDYHRIVERDKAKDYCLDLLGQVGLSEALYTRRPKALSGGQRQRAAIARALATEPKFIVLDEPVTALDISIQAQVLNLLIQLQKARDLTYLFIAHDLSVIRHVSDTTGVMYLGRLAELAPTKDLFEEPLHPYTRSLISSSPLLSKACKTNDIKLTGEVPSPIDPPAGCRFHTRCPFCFNRCRQEAPELIRVDEGHLVSCFLHGEN